MDKAVRRAQERGAKNVIGDDGMGNDWIQYADSACELCKGGGERENKQGNKLPCACVTRKLAEISGRSKERETRAPRTVFDFSGALYRLKHGLKVTRTGWNGRGQHIFLVQYSTYPEHVGDQSDDVRMMVVEPFICIRTVQGKAVPWLASQADLLAEDWREVSDSEIESPGDIDTESYPAPPPPSALESRPMDRE